MCKMRFELPRVASRGHTHGGTGDRGWNNGERHFQNDVNRRKAPDNRSKNRYTVYQDQDSLLVKRRNDNHSPGPVIRELVPSSHQRSELSNTTLCIFSG